MTVPKPDLLHDASRDALASFMAQHAAARRVRIVESQRLSGGAVQENWLVRADIEGGAHHGQTDFVVRTDSPSGIAVSHSRAQEFALLKAAFAAGVTVPEPLWLCEDRHCIGRPFSVMRRIPGIAAGHVLVKNAAGGGDGGQLARRLGSELARIHSIRPPRADLAFLPPPDGSPAMRAIERLRAALDKHHTPHPVLEWGLRWLTRHAPARGDIVLCHGDFRTGNYMVDADGLSGILDWEFAGWGDPLQDIGWFCARCWRFGAIEREAGGIGAREDFYQGYEKASGRPLARDRVHYWEVLAHVSWALIAMAQAERHRCGEETSLLLALTAHIVPELEYEILTMTRDS